MDIAPNFWEGQDEISLGKWTFDITCPTGKLLKKLISTPGLIDVLSHIY